MTTTITTMLDHWIKGTRTTSQLEDILAALPEGADERTEALGRIAGEDGYTGASSAWTAYAEDLGPDYIVSTTEGDILALGGRNGTDLVIISRATAEEED